MKEKWFYCECNIMNEWEVVCDLKAPREIDNPDTQECVNYFALNEDNKQDFIIMLLLDSMAEIKDTDFVNKHLIADITKAYEDFPEEVQGYVSDMVESATQGTGIYNKWLNPQNAEDLYNELIKLKQGEQTNGI